MKKKTQDRPKKSSIKINSEKLKGLSKKVIAEYKLGFNAGRQAGQGYGPIRAKANHTSDDIAKLIDTYWEEKKTRRSQKFDKPPMYIQGWKDAYSQAIEIYSDAHRVEYREGRVHKPKNDRDMDDESSTEVEIQEDVNSYEESEDIFDLPPLDPSNPYDHPPVFVLKTTQETPLDLTCNEELPENEEYFEDQEIMLEVNVSDQLDRNTTSKPMTPSIITPSISPLLRSPEMTEAVASSLDANTTSEDSVNESRVISSTPSISPLLRSPESTPPATPSLPPQKQQPTVSLMELASLSGASKPMSPLRSNNFFLSLELINFQRLLQKKPEDEKQNSVSRKQSKK